MDEICAYYKTPEDVSDWTKRHDPITIYSCKKITPEFLEAIKEIGRKYQRPNCTQIPLCGAQKDAPYLSCEQEASEELYNKIAHRALRHNKRFAEAMYDFCYKTDHHTGRAKFRASTGMLLSMEMALDEYIEFLRITQKH